MTNHSDANPLGEAITALHWAAGQQIGMTLDVDDVADLAAEIARLTAERDAALVRAERSERAERAAHDAANTAIKQRDDATAALAARDAAMRNEGRLQAAAVPFDKKYGKDWLGMTCAILATLEPEGGE